MPDANEEINLAAKEFLMKLHGLSEPDAHKFIQDEAMKRRLPKVIISKRILENVSHEQ